MINFTVGTDLTPAVIDEVQVDSPAFISGLKENDKILFIDNKKVESILEVSTFINTSTAGVTNTPDTTDPTDTVYYNSSIISPLDDHETETIDTTSRIQINSTIDPTIEPISGRKITAYSI